MNTLATQIDVMLAAQNGETIEIDYLQNGKWEEFKEAKDAQYNWHSYDYRIKSEPMELWVASYLSGSSFVVFTSEGEAEEYQKRNAGVYSIIKVREVTDE